MMVGLDIFYSMSLILRVTQKPIQKKTLAVWQRGFNSPDDTVCARNFEVIEVTFMGHMNFR